MDTAEIETLLLGHTYEDEWTYDYAGSRQYNYATGRVADELTGGHKKGEKYTVEMNDWYDWRETDPRIVPGLGLVESVEDFGGGEGSGEYTWFVLRITPEDGEPFLVRKEGYYVSYDGTTWDGDFAIVEPREKTITVYEAV